eukprot:TRINITY_DN14188_c0_g1_i2.p1 TRINITY_DN14188_c0_g1~~TRINITY_DN14188_c0_g1_i2.p1  ORF type:complete len:455 (-),score=83.66 TRINITY_DN14188_c0_g1_i2:76-1440(-)
MAMPSASRTSSTPAAAASSAGVSVSGWSGHASSPSSSSYSGGSSILHQRAAVAGSASAIAKPAAAGALLLVPSRPPGAPSHHRRVQSELPGVASSLLLHERLASGGLGTVGSSAAAAEPVAHRFCPWCGCEFRTVDAACSACSHRRGSSKPEKATGSSKQRWRKILWEKQPFDDNYVDDSFLNALIQNGSFVYYKFTEVSRGSTVVTQQLSCVCLFVLLFLYTWHGSLSLPLLLFIQAALIIAGYAIRISIDKQFNAKGFFGSFRTIVLLFGLVFTLSPVLRTLTNAFSTDTITACTAWLLVTHLAGQDYDYLAGAANHMHAPVALNAAMFASVLLASRLPSNAHVFALVSIAIEVFALGPIVRHHVRRHSERHQTRHDALLTWSLTGAAAALLVPISITLAVLYTAAVVLITVGCPALLVFIQRYKLEITGPWDEAVPMPSLAFSHQPQHRLN